MRRLRRSANRRAALLAALGSTALFMAVFLQPALAGDKPVLVVSALEVTITPIGETSATYAGTVTPRPKYKGKGKKEQARRRNAAARCKGNRKVDVWHGPAFEGFLIGSTRTDDRGRWTLTGNRAPTGDRISVVVDDVSRQDADCFYELEEVKSP
jgi:hypothetical protein